MKRSICLLLMPFLLIGGLHTSALEKEDRLWQDETIYYILVDRFLNGDESNDFEVDLQNTEAYYGGDFAGIIEKLDYLKDMGFTTIALSSIFDNGGKSYRGDQVINFYETEKHFGTIAEFRQLVKEAHKRDMKVMLEFVADTVSPEHEWAEKSGYFQGNSLKLNHMNEQLSEELIAAAGWWVEEADIDGYYINHTQAAPSVFWDAFSEEMRDAKSDFYILGNVSEGSVFKEKSFDGMVNLTLMEELRPAFADIDVNLAGTIDATEKALTQYSHPELNGTALDTISTARFTHDILETDLYPGTRWNLALAYTYTTPGIPFVLYGSEIALDGGAPPDNQQLMGFRADKELINYITNLGRLRQELPALTRGTFEVMHQESGMVVFKRVYKSEVLLVAINNTSKTQEVTIPKEQLENDKELRGLLNGEIVRQLSDGDYKIVLDREASEIYAMTDKAGLNIGFIAALAMVWLGCALFIYLVMKRSKQRR